jgi:hypothetical protein
MPGGCVLNRRVRPNALAEIHRCGRSPRADGWRPPVRMSVTGDERWRRRGWTVSGLDPPPRGSTIFRRAESPLSSVQQGRGSVHLTGARSTGGPWCRSRHRPSWRSTCRVTDSSGLEGTADATDAPAIVAMPPEDDGTCRRSAPGAPHAAGGCVCMVRVLLSAGEVGSARTMILESGHRAGCVHTVADARRQGVVGRRWRA